MFQSKKSGDPKQVHDTQLLMSARDLRVNGHMIPKSSFLSRKFVFNNEQNGLLLTKKNQPAQNMMADPSFMVDMLKGINFFSFIIIKRRRLCLDIIN